MSRSVIAAMTGLLYWLIAGPAAAGAVAARVLEVIDGDTLRVALAGGVSERVRLIGLDAPELVGPERGEEPYAAAAADFLGQLSPPGSVVRLVPGEEPRDRHGRLLAHVYGREGLLAEALLTRGLALACAILPNVALAEQLAAAQAGARRAGIGLWADPQAYAIVPSREARRHFGHCRGVAGRVSSVSRSQDGRLLRLHIRTAEDSAAETGGPDFAAVIFAEDQGAFPYDPVTAYAGEPVVVWGLITPFAGRAEIRVHWPGQIEVWTTGRTET